MNKNIVMTAEQYDRIDGRRAYRSDIKRLTLGAPTMADNQAMPIAAQVWKETAEGRLEISTELPLHQVIDLMVLLSRTLLHFREAYRLPLLYDPEKPTVERLGVQGGALSVAVCTENPQIKEDIQRFSQALNDLGELTGERLRVLSRILEELE
ncbi:hypothetical protein HMPREF0322_00802 [Desulfitobacterium hafniense DP7]|uniref:Uncharacterized protein n=1 Tax=Desulfitobacterium hafniense DP7 TaxID=537010 RepID=G9XIM6_DESHA|nr:DUF6530 family protein [Desulfitobacterium hafniense]EHL08490.1 hypothetical protein HMPREF0322_00802 [Desulfitobacterium hafniense DP7]